MINTKELNNYLHEFSMTGEQADKLAAFSNSVIENNKKFNLTSITDDREFMIKHIYDSLSVMLFGFLDTYKTIADVGTGAGIPGIPLAIMETSKKFTLIESNKKKAEFMKNACKELDIQNVVVIADRIEELAHHKVHREHYDCILMRAFANFSPAMEMSSALAKVKGHIIFYAGKIQAQDIVGSEKVFDKLKLSLNIRQGYSLPEALGDREILIVQKLWKTGPGFPRKYNKIKSNPL